MSLHDTMDGLLETQVTWEDLEKQLMSALKTKASFGTEKTIIDIGDGNGCLSRVGLVSCDWKGAEKSENLPGRIVIKIPSSLPLRQMNVIKGGEEVWEAMDTKLRELHNVEVAAYEFLENFDSLKIPRMYFGDKLNGKMCLEYVEKSRVMNFHEAHTVEQLRQVARALGKIQACSLKKETSASTEIRANMYPGFSKTLSLEAFCGMYKGLLALDDSEITSSLLEKVEAILPEYHASTLATTLHEQIGLRPVLVNGDLKTENVLIENESGDLLALIDWQCAHFGVGVQDLLRISLFALPAKERRESASMLVEEMYNSMVENLDGAEPPYSLEKLQSIYDILFPHTASYFAGGAIVVTNKLTTDAKLSMEEKETRKSVQLDKVLGSLDDILQYHVKNRELVKDLKFKDD